MPTVEDLRAAYAKLKEQAPTELTALDAPAGAHQQRRRIYLPLLVAAAVAAAVTGTVAVANSRSSSTHPSAAVSAASSPSASGSVDASADSAPLVTTYPFSVGALPDGLRAVDSSTTEHSATMLVESAQGEQAGFIVETDGSSNSGAKPDIPKDAVTVTIGSQTGYYGQVDQLGPSVVASGAAASTVAGVLWQTASGQWVSVTAPSNGSHPTTDNSPAIPGITGISLTKTQLVAIANATHVGTSHAAKSPVKFSYLPAGFQVLSTSVASGRSLADGNNTGMISVGRSDGSYVLDIGFGSKDAPSGASNPKSITIGAFSGFYSPDYNTVSLHNAKGQSIFVSRGDSSAGVALDDLTKIVQGITVASSTTDPSTWVDAAAALP